MRVFGGYRGGIRLAAFVCAAALAWGGPAWADKFSTQKNSPLPMPSPTAVAPAPSDAAAWSIEAASQEQEGDEIIASGNVHLRFGTMSLQADRVVFNRTTHDIRAEGSVVVWETARKITGDFVEMNLQTGKGNVYGAVGFEEPTFFFSAERVEMLARDRFIMHKGEYTSCNQPTPYWSIRGSRSHVRVGGYARFRNLRFQLRGAPVFYLPYWIWPIKNKRTTGFLIPQPSYSEAKGWSMRNQFYLVMGPSADATFTYDQFETFGRGAGLEVRFQTGAASRGMLDSYYFDQSESDRSRHFTRFEYYAQPWRGRFRAEIETASDLGYYRNFEYFLDATSKRRLTSNVFYSKSWHTYSMNALLQREANYINDNDAVVLMRLPEISLRRRHSPLWKEAPVFLSFESLLTAVDKTTPILDPLTKIKTDEIVWDYQRVVFRPTLSYPWSPGPWLSADFNLNGFGAFYTKSLDPLDSSRLQDESLLHAYWSGGVNVLGPRFEKIFAERSKGYFERFKHVIEPQASYTYRTEDEDAVGKIPRFDSYDSLSSFDHRISYGIVQYLYGKSRSGAAGQEIIKLSLSQTYSLNRERYLSYFYAPNGAIEDRSYFSDILLNLRVSPMQGFHVDAATSFNHMHGAFSNARVSSILTTPKGSAFNLTWSLARSLATGETLQQHVRAGATMKFLDSRLHADGEISYDIAQGILQHQRYGLRYQNQCSTFIFDVTQKRYGVFSDLEYRFTILLKDVGRLLSI